MNEVPSNIHEVLVLRFKKKIKIACESVAISLESSVVQVLSEYIDDGENECKFGLI